MLNEFKFVVVGSGFFGSVIAERIANDLSEKVLVIEKRSHIGGNCYSEDHIPTNIHFHKYGTHIFHTSNKKVYDYILQFTAFNSYYHQVLTTFKGRVYQMPINLETINSFFNVTLKPFEVNAFLKIKTAPYQNPNPQNFEEKALSLIGKDLYDAFIKGYSIKQWQVDPKEMSAEILKRLPFRNNYNESYYNSKWQGIPESGYGEIFNKMLSNKKIHVLLNTDYFSIKDKLNKDVILIYSGPIDKYFDYKYGKLEYRTLEFEEEVVDYEDFQGTSVMNYADIDIPYTRIHEPRHLHPERKDYPADKTLIIKEYSKLDNGENPYYPINNSSNIELLKKYKNEALLLHNVIISGRLGEYKYYDMHDTINLAFDKYEEIKHNFTLNKK